MIELDKAYDAFKYEADIYKQWMDSGYFNPDNLPGERNEAYSMTLPPPNATGTLHLGHAFELSAQDIIIRYQRMNGKKTLWLPGTDHAAIATNTKVEKEMIKKEGKNRHDIGKPQFVKRVKDFVESSRGVMQDQIRRMGASVDWHRERFTMDEHSANAVKTAFLKLHELGLIYIGERIVNWDAKGQTTVSDDEVINETRQGKLYTFKYSKDFPIAIATTRPETKVGDTAVAVNPSDDRYKEYVGKEYDIDFAGTTIHIKIVADDSVDREFGTGALGVTPAHSQIDYEIAQRHNLPLKQVINEYAKMMDSAGPLVAGKKTGEAKEIIVNWLSEQGLLENTEDIEMSVPTADRSGGVIEPLPKRHQWFVAVDKPFVLEKSKINGIENGQQVTLKQLMRHVVQTGQIKITPPQFEKVYFHWIDHLRDWNISRQLWYGHDIPAWYRGEEEIHVGENPPPTQGWQQFEDTLDTWFSSALWTFSTLGWPDKTKDLETYHPTSLIMPGYEILFFWVARMILMSVALLGEVPFRQVLLHGIVRDSKGRKFSKSLDNGIDPIEMSDKYGMDALRYALVFNSAPGNDVSFDEQKVKGMKHFANKLWNISRYILQNTTSENFIDPKPNANTDEDKLILNMLSRTSDLVKANLDEYNLHLAAQKLYDFTWYFLADAYIEKSKIQLSIDDQKESTQENLAYALVTILKLLHPFMPFITEVIWGQLNQKQPLLITQWPK